MERIRVSQKPNLAYNIVVILLIIGILLLSLRLLSNSKIFLKDNSLPSESRNFLESEEGDKAGEGKDFFSEIWIRIKGMDFTNPTFILSSHMPYLNIDNLANESEYISEGKDETVVTSADQGQGVSRQSQRPSTEEMAQYQESEGQDQEISEDMQIQIQIKNISDDLPPVNLTGEGPQILIYHTHSREAYRQDPSSPYKAIAAFRCNDLNQTVVGVGDELARQLERRNIPVLHDKTDHEVYTWKSGLYPRSLETIKKRQEEHESLKIFLDIHRNYNENLKDPDKEVVVINGERAAKFFVLIGTGQGVSGGFDQKPKWKENYQFALKITNKANELYPGLASDVMIRTGRYNQHISNKAILIEVGNHLTTVAEAKRTANYIAEVISQVIEK